MKDMESAFGRRVIALRWAIIPLTLIALFLMASGGQHLRFTSDYRVYFSDDNPQLQAFEAMEATYTKDDNVLMVLTPPGGDVFNRDTLALVEELTEQAWQIPYSIRVDSITNFQHTYAEGDDLIVGDLVAGAQDLSDRQLAGIRDIALNEPLLIKRLVSDQGHVTAINVTVQLPGVDETKEVPEVVSFVRAMADEVRAAHPDVGVHLTGMVFLNNAFSENSQTDMATLVPLSFGIMLLCLVLLLRGLTGTVATILVIFFSILTAMGLGGYLGFPLTPSSVPAPIIILTIAIANSVHILVTFYFEIRHGRSKHEAMVESLRVNLQPVFLTSLTTAIGFLTMNFSEVPPFQHLGNLVAIGVMASFVYAVTFLPALMYVLPVRVKEVPEDKVDMMDKLGDFVVANKTGLLWSMLAVVVVLVAMVPRNELNDVFVHYFDERIEFRTDTDYVTDNLNGLYFINYSLRSKEQGAVADPAFLRDVEAFTQWLRQQPEVTHVNTVTDIFKRLNKNMHGDDPAFYNLPQERNLAAQYLLLYEMSLPYGLDLNNQINVDKSSTRLTASLLTISTNQMLEFEQRANQWLRDNAPAIAEADPASPTLMFSHISQRNVVSMLMGTTLALLLISGILIFALRSLKIGLVSMVPNLVPAAMGFGVWGLMVGEVGLALSIVTGMTMGIVVDDTVHFLSKYLRARREKGLGASDAVRYAFHNVGRALLFTSIILVAGFAVLATSGFKLNSDMGALSAMVIALALLADFLLLPALLMKLEEKENEKIVVRDPALDAAS